MGYGLVGRETARAAPAVREREEAYVAGARGAPASDPDSDPDVLHDLGDLGDQIALLAAQLSAGKYPMLRRIARFDRLRGWEPGGHRSCAHWLCFRTGYGLGTARELVRVALALQDLPETRAALARGSLPYCKARAVTRAARPESEAELLELAGGCTTGDLERVIRAWKRGTRKDEAGWEQERHASRCLSVFPDDTGSYMRRAGAPSGGAIAMPAARAPSPFVTHADRSTSAGPQPRRRLTDRRTNRTRTGTVARSCTTAPDDTIAIDRGPRAIGLTAGTSGRQHAAIRGVRRCPPSGMSVASFYS